MDNRTIFAPATARGRAGIAVVRISGTDSLKILESLCGISAPKPKEMIRAAFCHEGETIDQGLAVYFKAPHSFTGEDVVEFHTHGSAAVVKRLMIVLAKFGRLAWPGEFSRRALLNGKMDLTAAEGMIDLINAETEMQRKIALKQYQGREKQKYDLWRQQLNKVLAWVEAYLDFPEEEVNPEIVGQAALLTDRLISDIQNALNRKPIGERLRTGYKIALIGRPNVGKSSLLNALVKRNVAIVSDIAGTTRDVIESYVDINGYPVIFIDTAGIRQSNDTIEQEGVARALAAAEEADLIIYLKSPDDQDIEIGKDKVIAVYSKADLYETTLPGIRVSVKAVGGLDGLIAAINERLEKDFSGLDHTLITRERHRQALQDCLDNLLRSRNNLDLPLKAEDLRRSSHALATITGAVASDELLDIIFADFCIGK